VGDPYLEGEVQALAALGQDLVHRVELRFHLGVELPSGAVGVDAIYPSRAEAAYLGLKQTVVYRLVRLDGKKEGRPVAPDLRRSEGLPRSPVL
jgi:hypothetical protein